jgi:tRNA-specific 2-thiouridylase
MSGKTIIAMSGGVDSSVAAALAKEQSLSRIHEGDHELLGVTLKLHSPDLDVKDAEQAAHRLGIPHCTLNFTEAFHEKVIHGFIETYEAGDTPNPCINCNRSIKFNSQLFMAQGLDYDLLVTGHYARIDKDISGRWLLRKAADNQKDQSYVLYCLTQEQLKRACFPLGNLTKSQVREIARDYGFISAEKQESQDICFVPDGDYGTFMEQYTGKHYPEGDIIDAHGKTIGRHKGIVRYTLGQRRGLGVAANDRIYVTAKDMAHNTITLGNESSLYAKTLVARNINLIACENLEKPLHCMVKTRYLQQEKPALAEQTGPDEIHVTFDELQRAITPGQAAVLYDNDVVIGGGTIVG